MEDEMESPSDGRHRKDAERKLGGSVSKKRTKKNKGSLGHQIRGIERLLAKIGDKMAPAAKRAKEEEIQSLKSLQKDRTRRQKETDMSQKYRMLKFIERQKVERQLKQIDGKTDAESVRKREQLTQDLLYISQYPKDCKYVALFPSGGHTEESKKQVDEMRRRIEGKGAPDEAAASSSVGSLEKTEGGNERAEAVPDEPEDDFFLAYD